MKHFDNIILNIPHSSTNLWFDGWGQSLYTMYPLVKKWTDWHTDILFYDSSTIPVIFPYSRFYCDVERLINDELNNIGQGIIYSKFENHKRFITDICAINKYYDWKEEFRNKIVDNPNALIIDCHSFPNEICPDIDINIGFNDDWSKPDDDMIEWIKSHFENNGYKVGINKPYSNSITPVDGYAYKSIMLEINKSAYMDENTLDIKPEEFSKLKHLIKVLYLYVKNK